MTRRRTPPPGEAVLSDPLGPRGRRRVLAATALAALGVALVAAVAFSRLAARGQLRAELWRPLLDPGTMRFLLGGLGNTVRAAAIAMALATVAGALLALVKLSRRRSLRALAGAYVEFFRGVPLVLLILFCGLGLPRYGVDLGPLWFLVLGLTLYNAAVLCEIFRAGIASLDRGQQEAAYALGLSRGQAMRSVIVPQALRRMLPAVVSQLVILLKDTSLGVVIPYEELLRRGRIAGEFSHNVLQSLFVVALMYIAVNSALSQVVRRLEARQRRSYRSRSEAAMAEAVSGPAAMTVSM